MSEHPHETGARATAPRAAIQFEAAAFRRGRIAVLDDFNLAVGTGETLVLVGRSGAGKSTILKLINKLLVPDGGRVVVEGRDTRLWNTFELRRRVGYVLQEVGLFPHMTVGQNIAIVPRLLAWGDTLVRRRTDELLELVGLPPAEYRDRHPRELSGGQRQRVGVARALAGDPPVMLMDEPFGALDPVTRSEIHGEFRAIQNRVRKTVVIVTHDMGEAFALATRIGVVAGGRLIALDTPNATVANLDPRIQALLAPMREAAGAVSGSLQ